MGAARSNARIDGVTTPVRRQYLDVKARHPDAIVLFRMGDFYETFDDDARVAARDLEIVLTQRDMGGGAKVPLAGIPYHALDSYLARLIKKGHRVAICEQTSEPDGRRLVDREVVRVVTPGTVVEPALLEESANSYLAAVAVDGERAGIAYVDVTTGEFAATETPAEWVGAELARLAPREVLLPADAPAPPAADSESAAYLVTHRPASAFVPEVARRLLLDHFGAVTLEAFSLEGMPLAAAAAGAVADYLADTHKAALALLYSLRVYRTGSFMALDPQTRRNLELFEGGRRGERAHSLLGALDATKTPMGARMVRRWVGEPLLEVAALERRLDAVEWLKESAARRGRIERCLAQVGDVERALHRMGAGAAPPREVAALRRALEQAPPLRETLAEAGEWLAWLWNALDPCAEAVGPIAAALGDEPQGEPGQGGVIRQGFSRELDELRGASTDARAYIAGLESRERQRSGIISLKVGYNKVFGYYLEVTNPHLARVPDDYIRRQTLTNGERFYTPELKEYESRVLNARERMEELEGALYRQLCRQVAGMAEAISATAQAMAAVDTLTALAEAAARYGYVPSNAGRRRRHRSARRASPCRRTPAPGGGVRPQRPRPFARRPAGARGDGPEYGRQVHLLAPSRPHRLDGADWLLRPCRLRPHRPRRPHLHPRRTPRRPGRWPVHLHGGDGGDGGHPPPGHGALPGGAGRDRPRHLHIRRPLHRPSRRRAHPQRPAPRLPAPSSLPITTNLPNWPRISPASTIAASPSPSRTETSSSYTASRQAALTAHTGCT